MPVIRPFTHEESAEYNKLSSLCFSYALDEKDLYADDADLPYSRALFDDDGRLQGGMFAFDFLTTFCGGEVHTAGIGGVVSRPEQRRQRTIRKIFEQLLPSLYAEGYTLSALYPFSHAYYRKFGYEQCVNRFSARFPLESLQSFESIGRVTQLLPGDDRSELEAVYRAYIRKFDLAVLRDEKRFDKLLGKEPSKELQFVYLWRNDAGEAQGYAVCKTVKDAPFENTMELLEMAYLTPEALRGLLGFFKNFGSHAHFAWRVNPDVQLKRVFPEPYEIDVKYGNDGMVRIINVEKALSMLPASPVDGRFTVRVSDAQIAPNNATFAVESRGGALTVTRVEDATADLELPVSALAPLVMGSTPFDVYHMSNQHHTLRREDASMRYVFGQRMSWMNDGF